MIDTFKAQLPLDRLQVFKMTSDQCYYSSDLQLLPVWQSAAGKFTLCGIKIDFSVNAAVMSEGGRGLHYAVAVPTCLFFLLQRLDVDVEFFDFLPDGSNSS